MSDYLYPMPGVETRRNAGTPEGGWQMDNRETELKRMTEDRQNHDLAPDDSAHDLLSGIITACEKGFYEIKPKKVAAPLCDAATVFLRNEAK